MGNLFSVDSGLSVFLSKVFDIMMLSIVYILFCIPIITIGPATIALYYTTVKGIRRDRGYIFKNFWHSFKTNFVSGAIVWVIVLILGVIFNFNIRFAINLQVQNRGMGFVLVCIYGIITFIYACMTAYLFPVISRFSMSIKQTFKICILMGIRHLPFTILLLVILIGTILASWFLMPISFFFFPGISCWIYSLIMENILKKYINSEENEDGTIKDEWYLE